MRRWVTGVLVLAFITLVGLPPVYAAEAPDDLGTLYTGAIKSGYSGQITLLKGSYASPTLEPPEPVRWTTYGNIASSPAWDISQDLVTEGYWKVEITDMVGTGIGTYFGTPTEPLHIGTNYIRARNFGGNWKLRFSVPQYSEMEVASVRYYGDPDLEPPLQPVGLVASPGLNSVSLSWSANSESDLAGYVVYVDGVKHGETAFTTYTVEGLTGDVETELAVAARDTGGNESPRAVITAVPYGPDIQAPAIPQGLSYVAKVGAADLTWSANGEVDLAGYRVYLDGVQVADLTETAYTIDLAEERGYQVGVSAYDTSGNESEHATTTAFPIDPNAPTEPPQPPVNMVTSAGANMVTIRWNAPPGVVPVESYNIYRDGGLIGTTASLSWTDTGLEPRRTYTYGVAAVNDAGESPSTEVQVTTVSPGVIDGVKTSLSGLGQRLQEGIHIILPFFLVAAGIMIARIVLRTGLTWFQAQRRSS